MKKCFVISPIGEEGSDVRKIADQVLKHLIMPVTQEYGYETVRADKIADSGLITKAILQNIISSDLVIADLSRHNPNVFYELAVRHAFGKPVIQIIDKEYNIPFDVFDMWTIHYSMDLDGIDTAKEKLKAAIEQIPEDGFMETPISEVASLVKLSDIGNSEGSGLTELVNELQRIPEYLNALEHRMVGRIEQILSDLSSRAAMSPEEKLNMLLFEKMLDNPNKLNQIMPLIEKFDKNQKRK
jgi:hypothetical protein